MRRYTVRVVFVGTCDLTTGVRVAFRAARAKFSALEAVTEQTKPDLATVVDIYRALAPVDKVLMKSHLWQHMHIFLGIFEWRYLFIPIGCNWDYTRFELDDSTVYVTAKHVFIFGVRIARWVTKVERIAHEKVAPEK